MDLIERINQWGRLTPDRPAHISAGEVLTYRELIAKSNLLADHLINNLPQDKSPVGILGHKENEMLIGFLGCVKSGHPYIPLDTSLPPQRVYAIVKTAEASLLLKPEDIADLTHREPSSRFEMRRPQMDDAWYIIFTSGSTGDPKGVVISRECLESFIGWILDEQGFKDAGEIFLNQAPFSFDLSVMDLYSSLATGGTLFSISKEEIAELRALYQSFAISDITTWVSTPSFARMCLMDAGFKASLLPGVRKFWFCGETLAPDVAANLIQRFPQAEVWNTYGPTEATVATTSIHITRHILEKYPALPVGRAKPEALVEVHNSGGTSVPEGERGEIIIAGTNVGLGYIHRPDLTSKSFFEYKGWRAYRTGDAGHFQDNLLFFDGRLDFQIKLYGYRIEIGDIEANLQALDNVQDAVVIPAMVQERADHLVAFVIFKEPPSGSDFEHMQRLRKGLAARLPDYMVPRRFVFLREFPLTPNGKADRRKLAETLQ
jgi:D-alanine--poly(phosphoribitol) ligase subunit 1